MFLFLSLYFFLYRVTSLQSSASLQHSSVWGNCPSMRWSCKCCNFSSPNQRTLIVHYKLKHCHQASNQRKRAAALQGLPWYMKENPSTLLKRCEPTDPEEDFIKGMVIGILLVVEDVKEPLPVSYNDVAIVIEEKIVLRHLADVPNAVVNLMGLLYMLNLDYPKEMKYTFEVIQRLFMGIGSEACTPRVYSLKNKLLS
ncbi:uncharacterized protein LOC120470382 isoform X3 [Pimephales promelas]|uniref:uncharacterized protein LOC120470382 isoform X3 n=1 Tax=Pimephales promelas TaxID=90988 RepID=UPI001955F01D|nr:uncharacterized protein LOC120470382 isoform X3 [Pimephales promelas]